jgi:hypothetical protein
VVLQRSGDGLSAVFVFRVPEDPMSIAELGELVAVGSVLVEASARRLSVSLSAFKMVVAKAMEASIPPVEPELGDITIALSAALKVCRAFDLPQDTLVSARRLVEQREQAVLIPQILERSDGPIVIEGRQGLAVGQRFGVVREAGLRLYDRILVVVFAFFGSVTECVELSKNRYQITAQNGRVLYDLCMLSTDTTKAERELSGRRRILQNELKSAGLYDCVRGS